MANVLSADKVAELLASSKQRGVYEDELKSILAHGNRGEQVDLESGTLAGKKPQSVKTGLENAKKKLDEDVRANVRIILSEDQVFVINTAVEA